MRLLIYGINYAPELVGIGKYTGEMAEWLALRKHDVYVVTSPAHYPQWKVQPPYRRFRYQKEILNGVHVLRCPIWLPSKLTFFRRAIHLLSFAFTSAVPLWLAARRLKPDVILTVEPPFLCAPAAWIAARLCGAKSWLHVQDFELDAAFELGLLKNGSAHYWAERGEAALMRRFQRVSTLTPAMQARAQQKGVRTTSAYLFPNWVDTNAIHPTPTDPDWRRRMGVDGRFAVLYSGSMGSKQGLEVLIEAARLLQDDRRIQFVLSGEGPMRPVLQDLSQGLANVSFHGLQPSEHFNAFLNIADVHVVLQRSEGNHCFMPSKLTTLMANGRAVLAVTDEASPVAAALAGRGRIVAPGDSRQLAEAIRALAQNPDECQRSGQAVREYAVTHWAKDKILEHFEAELQRLSAIT